jgi:hypothetical protein
MDSRFNAVRKGFARTAVALAVSGATLFLTAGAVAGERVQLTDASFMEIDSMVLAAKGRPNEEARLSGLKAMKTGHQLEAVKQFERAAYFADKYSQHYLSLLNWHGDGIPQDRVQAYIWSDLAAERGSKRLLLIREKMWGQLTATQQQEAVERGVGFYAKYGDEVAQPRAESQIRHYARDMTGSRVGYRNQQLAITGAPVNGAFAVQTGSNAAAYAISNHATPDELYGEEGGLSRLVDYWKEQDRLLDGNVEVGPLETMRTRASDGDGMGG